MSVPGWIRKPIHKKTVVATEKGWVVAETKELLVSVIDFDKKLKEYFGTDFDFINSKMNIDEIIEVEEPIIEPVVEQVTKIMEPEKEKPPVVEKKKPGPKPKQKLEE